MPIYNYSCKDCLAEFQKIVSIKERDKTDWCCPECGCVEITRIIGLSNFSLKGKGWYKDGYEKKEN